MFRNGAMRATRTHENREFHCPLQRRSHCQNCRHQWSEGTTRGSKRTARIRQHPNRLDRIRAFALFVLAHRSLLQRYPELTIPIAFNHATDGPVVEAARSGLAICPSKWISRDPRPPGLPVRPSLLYMSAEDLGNITTVAMTTNERTVVSGLEDGRIAVWDTHFGICQGILRGHASTICSLAITADGTRVASSSEDGIVKVWDLEHWQCERTLVVWEKIDAFFDSDLSTVVAITADGRMAVTGSPDGLVCLWDLLSGECIWGQVGHSYRIDSVSVTLDSKRAVTRSWMELKVWDLDSGRCENTINQPNWSVGESGLVLTMDGNMGLRSKSSDIEVLTLPSGACKHTLKGQAGLIRSLSIAANGKRAISGASDGMLTVWDIENEQYERILPHHSSVNAVAISADGRRGVSGSKGGLTMWDLDGTSPNTLEGHSRPVIALAVTPDGKSAISGTFDDHIIKIWDAERGVCIKMLKDLGIVYSLALSPDGKRAVCGSLGEVSVWDLAKEEQLWVRDWQPGAYGEDLEDVIAVFVNHGGDRVVAVSLPGKQRDGDTVTSEMTVRNSTLFWFLGRNCQRMRKNPTGKGHENCR